MRDEISYQLEQEYIRDCASVSITPNRLFRYICAQARTSTSSYLCNSGIFAPTSNLLGSIVLYTAHIHT